MQTGSQPSNTPLEPIEFNHELLFILMRIKKTLTLFAPFPVFMLDSRNIIRTIHTIYIFKTTAVDFYKISLLLF